MILYDPLPFADDEYVAPVVEFLTFGLPVFDELHVMVIVQVLLFAAMVQEEGDAEILPDADGVTHDDPSQTIPPLHALHEG